MSSSEYILYFSSQIGRNAYFFLKATVFVVSARYRLPSMTPLPRGEGLGKDVPANILRVPSLNRQGSSGRSWQRYPGALPNRDHPCPSLSHQAGRLALLPFRSPRPPNKVLPAEKYDLYPIPFFTAFCHSGIKKDVHRIRCFIGVFASTASC